MFIRVVATAPDNIAAIDTHRIWRDGQRLTRGPSRAAGGEVDVPATPSLGTTLDMAQLEKTHALYEQHGLDTRDDAMVMRQLILNWQFDNEHPYIAC